MTVSLNQALDNCGKTSTWTPVQIARGTCYIGSALAACDGIRRSDPIGLVEGISAIAFAITGWRLKDYQNPKELAAMQAKAAAQTFTQVADDHGLEMIVKRAIVPDLAQKFNQEYQHTDFIQLLGSWPLKVINHYNLVPKREQLSRLIQALLLPTFSLDDISKLPLQELRQYEVINAEQEQGLREKDAALQQIEGYRQDGLNYLNEQYPLRLEKIIEKLRLEKKKIPEQARVAGQHAENAALAATVRTAGTVETVEALLAVPQQTRLAHHRSQVAVGEVAASFARAAAEKTFRAQALKNLDDQIATAEKDPSAIAQQQAYNCAIQQHEATVATKLQELREMFHAMLRSWQKTAA